ncbi:mechanosensitive ion channel family protein [Colwelliaceae bacterium BS250]
MNTTFFSSIVVLLLTVSLLTSPLAHSQELTLKEVKERQQNTQQAIEDAQLDIQIGLLTGDTPLSAILLIGESVKDNDFDEAGNNLDLRYLPQNMLSSQKGELIRQLNIVWSQQNALDISTISNDPEGHLNDGLPPYRDLLGIIKTSSEDIPIYLQRITNERGQKIWKISSNSVAKIPMLWQEFGYHPLAESIAAYLPSFVLFDMQNWQFVSSVLILFIAWNLTALIRLVLLKLVSYSDVYSKTMRRFIRVPMRLFLFFIFWQWGTSHLGLSLNARVWLDSGVLSYLASMFLFIGIIEFSFAMYISRPEQEKNATAILKPVVTTLKIITVIVIALNWFSAAGYNITAIITGLGIGSLAIALAAQKSLENVFGAFTLFFARPIKPGDMCKFGNTQGRVEEIGLRSTKIRKLDRKVVHVPNSTIASMELENISEIDNRRYLKFFRIRLNTPTNKLKELVTAIRTLIESHPNTIALERYVRFENVDDDAFIIVVNTYVTASGRVEYKKLEELLNFQIMDVIDLHKIELAIPEQYLSINQK